MTPDVNSEYYTAKKRRIIYLLFAYSVVCGFLAAFLPEEDTPLDFVAGLPFLFLGIAWCFADADERGHRIGVVTKFALVLLGIFGFPLYVFQTRGIQGFKALFFAMLLVAALFACMFAALLVTLFTGEAMGVWEVTA